MNALEMRPPDTLALADIASIAEVNNMVVAVDFSSMTHAVLNAAVILAGQRKDARVTLLFVIPEDNYVVGDIGVIRGPFAMNKRDAAMDELKKLRATQFQASTNVDVMVREGFPATEICDTADERGADLIVVASHGRTGLNRIMMGSTAEEVVHGARCSVMIVKPAEAKGNPGKLPGLHDVAVAFDGSSSSRAALATALKLVRHGTTSLHLIQAVWPFPIASGDIPIETDEVRVQDAQEELTRVCDQIPGSLHIKSHVEMGKPWRVVRDVATKCGADLLIIGAHEHWHLGESILGTTAERVVRHASCSVLVVRPSRSAMV